MKKYLTTSMFMLFAATALVAQNNVNLVPNGGTVCNPMNISVAVNGNGFNPTSYLWSTGETSASIQINESDTYTVTITGTQGNSGNTVSHTKSAFFTVLDPPFITPVSNLWVCKGDTVRLAAVNGYDEIYWSNSATGTLLEQEMNYMGTFGNPQLDTLTVNYTAVIDGLCATTSQSLLLRAIRKPDGVGRFYRGNMNIELTDSIPAGLILEYLYPVTYHMTFTDLSDPSNVVNYTPAPGSRKAPASILSAGTAYSVETTPEINGQMFCAGTPSVIGIAASSNRDNNQVITNDRLSLDFNAVDEGVSTFKVFDLSGRLLMEKQAERFNNEWLKNLTPQLVIVERTGVTKEIKKIQIIQ